MKSNTLPSFWAAYRALDKAGGAQTARRDVAGALLQGRRPPSHARHVERGRGSPGQDLLAQGPARHGSADQGHERHRGRFQRTGEGEKPGKSQGAAGPFPLRSQHGSRVCDRAGKGRFSVQRPPGRSVEVSRRSPAKKPVEKPRR